MLRIYEELTEEEFILTDRLQKIRAIITNFGEKNFYIAFSGGKDSTVLSSLVDLALPDNDIPRVYADTGIELNMIRDFVYKLKEKDKRIKIIKPSVPIIKSLEEDGFPFKSKNHAHHVERFNRIGMCPSVKSYLGEGKWGKKHQCPKILRYQFDDDFKDRLLISDKCCVNLKEKPLEKWSKEHKKPYAIVGIRKDEGGRRENAVCTLFVNNKLKRFQPLSVVEKAWEDWFIQEYNIEICPIYLPPYNFDRTGCKGCPFSRNLQQELDTLEKHFPEEKKQCEILWKPVYDEYRRLNYRLKKTSTFKQMTLNDYI